MRASSGPVAGTTVGLVIEDEDKGGASGCGGIRVLLLGSSNAVSRASHTGWRGVVECVSWRVNEFRDCLACRDDFHEVFASGVLPRRVA